MQGKLALACKTLQRIREEAQSREWQKGYVNALDGMLSALESKNDRSVLINQIRSEELEKLARAFSRQTRNRMQSEFDHGFFSAWADYAKTLKESTKPQTEPKNVTKIDSLDSYTN